MQINPLTLSIETLQTTLTPASSFPISSSPKIDSFFKRQAPPFFVETEEDKFIKQLIDCGAVDRTGKLHKKFSDEFVLPPLEKEQIQSIQKLINTKTVVTGRNTNFPLDIEITPKEILKKGIEAAKAESGNCVKICGSRFRHILGTSYFYKVLHKFFNETLQRSDLDISKMITPFLKERVKKRGVDADFHLFFLDAGMEKCTKASETIFEVLESNLDKESLSLRSISNYLKKLKARIRPLEGHKYLKEVLQNDDALQENHPLFYRTYLKVVALIQAAKIYEKHFFVYSIGDRKANNFDFVYFASKQNIREGIFTTDGLGAFIDPLLEENNETPIVPYSSDNEALQYFIDNNAAIYRRKKGDTEERDFEKALSADIEGMKSLESSAEILLQALEANGKKGRDFALEVSSLLKHATKSLYTNDLDCTKLISLTFRACQYLLIRGDKYDFEIKEIWKEIFSYVEDAGMIDNLKRTHPFFHILTEAIQSSHLQFKEIEACLQIACYVGLNIPNALDEPYKVIITQNEKGPLMQLNINVVNSDQFFVFSFSFEPDKALNQILKIYHKEALNIIKSLYHVLIPNSIQVSSKLPSPLSKYEDHPILKTLEIAEMGKLLIQSFNPFLRNMGYEVLFALLKQKFNPNLLPSLLRPLVLSSDQMDLRNKKKIMANIGQLHEGSLLEDITNPHSSLMAALVKEQTLEQQMNCILEIAKTPHRAIKQLALDLYSELEISIPREKQEDFLFKLFKILLTDLELLINLSLKITKSERTASFVKLRVLCGSLGMCLKNKTNFLIQVLLDELINLLRTSSLEISPENRKYVEDLSKVFSHLISQMISSKEFDIAYDLMSFGLEKNLIVKDSKTSQQWLLIISHCFNEPSIELVKTYDIWKLAQKFYLLDSLDIAIQNEIFLKLSTELSKAQEAQDSAQKFTAEIIQNAKDDSLVYPLFLGHFKNKLINRTNAESMLKVEEIDYFLSSFVQLIQKNRDLKLYWIEEKKLIEILLQNIFHSYSIEKSTFSNLFNLKIFLEKIYSSYPSSHIVDLTGIMIEIWQRVSHSKEKVQESMFQLVETYLQNFISLRLYRILPDKMLRDIILFCQKEICSCTLANSQLMSLKNILQSSQTALLMEFLYKNKMLDELAYFLLIFSFQKISPPSSKIYFECLLWTLENFSEKAHTLKFNIDIFEELVHFNISWIINSKNKELKQQLTPICQRMYALRMLAQDYSKAFFWFEKEKELNSRQQAKLPPLLALKIVQSKISNYDFASAIKILSEIPYDDANRLILEGNWNEILQSLPATNYPIQSSKIVLCNSIFDTFSAKQENSIILIIEALILHYRKRSDEYSRNDVNYDELSYAYNIIEKLKISNGDIWIKLLTAIKQAKAKVLMGEVINFLYHQPPQLSEANLIKCWNIAIIGLKNLGHPCFVSLLEEKQEILSLLKDDELFDLKQSTYKALCQGIVAYFHRNVTENIYPISRNFFILLLIREISNVQENGFDEKFLKRFERVLLLRNKANLLTDGFKYLKEAVEDDVNKMKSLGEKIRESHPKFVERLLKMNPKDAPDIRELHTPLLDKYPHEINELLRFAFKQFRNKINKATGNKTAYFDIENNRTHEIIASDPILAELEKQTVAFIQFLKTECRSFNPGILMMYLLTFGKKYFREVGHFLQLMFSSKPRDIIHQYMSPTRTFYARIIREFLISDDIELNECASKCLASKYCKDWVSYKHFETLKSIKAFPFKNIKIPVIHNEVVNINHAAQVILKGRGAKNKKAQEEFINAQIALRNKVQPVIKPLTSIIFLVCKIALVTFMLQIYDSIFPPSVNR